MADEETGSTRSFLILIFGVGVLLCCGVPIGGGYLYVKDSRDEPGMRAVGEAYLTAVVQGENGTAYDLLCQSDRRKRPRPAGKPAVDRPTAFRITDVTIERPNEAPTQRIVTAEITYPNQRSTEVNLYVEKQDGVWKVCSPPSL